jgi:hypothetical protein
VRVADYRPWPSASAGRPWQGRGRGDCSPWPPPGLLMRIRPGPTEVGCNPRRGSRAQLSPLHVAGVADGQCGRTQGQLSRGQKAMGHGCMHLYRRQHRCRVGPGGWAEAISGRKGRRGLREAPNEGHVGLYGATERPIPWHPETQFHPWQKLNIPPVGQDTRYLHTQGRSLPAPGLPYISIPPRHGDGVAQARAWGAAQYFRAAPPVAGSAARTGGTAPWKWVSLRFIDLDQCGHAYAYISEWPLLQRIPAEE